MRETGQQVVKRIRGNDHGLRCLRCAQFHNHSEFGKLSRPCKPTQQAKKVVEQQTPRTLENNLKVQELMATKRLGEEINVGTPPFKNRCTGDNKALAPTQDDDQIEAEELNSEGSRRHENIHLQRHIGELKEQP